MSDPVMDAFVMTRPRAGARALAAGIHDRLASQARRRATALSLLSGACSVLAFAPFGLYPLGVLCLAALFGLTRGATPRRATWIGLCFGLGQFAAGTYWLFTALHTVGGAPTVLSLALMAALVLAMALYPAAVLGLAARFVPDAGPVRHLLWLPALWTLAEWLRGWLLTGFPWFSLGYSQIDAPLAGYAPLFGVFGVSMAVALSAGLLLQMLAARRRWLPAALALGLLWLGGGLLRQVDWTHPVGPPLRVALVQGDVAQATKWRPDAGARDLQHYLRLSRDHWNNDLVVWPESALPAFYRAVRPQLSTLGVLLKSHHTTLLTGLLHADGGRAYNSVAALGASRGFYDKRHLVPFGETFPVPGFVRRWLAGMALPHSNFTVGARRQPLLTAAGYPLGVSVCYEDAFGGAIARTLPAAAILVNVSDDAWFGRSIGPAQHFQIARMRALESGRFLLRADNSSVTAVVGPHGTVRRRLPGFEPGVLTASIRPYGGTTPFVRWGNAAVVGLALTLLLAGAALRRRRSAV